MIRNLCKRIKQRVEEEIRWFKFKRLPLEERLAYEEKIRKEFYANFAKGNKMS